MFWTAGGFSVPAVTNEQIWPVLDRKVQMLRGAWRGSRVDRPGNPYAAHTLSLDVLSGLDATTGETSGPALRPERTLTLALPKTGLKGVPGEFFLAEVDIPPVVYEWLGLALEPFFGDRYWMRLVTT
jgi:hypothetical protein